MTGDNRIAALDQSEAHGAFRDTVIKDLDYFALFVERGGVENIEKSALVPDLTEDKIRDIIPFSIIRLSSAILDPAGYMFISDEILHDRQDVLLKARETASHIFSLLMGKEAFRTVLREVLEKNRVEKPDTDVTSFTGTFNVPGKVMPMQMLVGAVPELVPLVRMGIADNASRLLLDMTVEWDDLLFLAASFVGAVAEQAESIRPLADQELIAVDKQAFRDALADVKSNLQKLESAAHPFMPGQSDRSDS